MSKIPDTNRSKDAQSKTDVLSSPGPEKALVASSLSTSHTNLPAHSYQTQTENTSPRIAQSGDVDVVTGLVTILSGVREEVRALRIGFLSNLILAFTIPLGALATQNLAIFKTSWLWVIPAPRWWIFSLWVVGVITMAVGLLAAVPGPNTTVEDLANYRAKQAADYLTASRISEAIEQMNLAISKEFDRLTGTQKSRFWFLLSLISFLLCVGLEFALVLFS